MNSWGLTIRGDISCWPISLYEFTEKGVPGMNGILMKPDMIKAIIEDRKTQTRRGIKELNQEPDRWEYIRTNKDGRVLFWVKADDPEQDIDKRIKLIKPRFHVGEVVYIKEAWATEKRFDSKPPSFFGDAATVPIWWKFNDDIPETMGLDCGRWRSPLHLPQWLARYFIQITDVRAERLQEITLADIYAEGCPLPEATIFTDPMAGYENQASAFEWYHDLWDSINGKVRPEDRKFTLDNASNRHYIKGQIGRYPWSTNPWCWVYKFRSRVMSLSK